MFRNGFSLAELMVALLILGNLMAFTIPKVLTSTTNNRYNAVAKEDLAAVSEAFNIHKLKGNVSAETWTYDLLPYLNYISSTTGGVVDDVPGGTTTDCNAWNSSLCLKMHNGSTLWVHNCKLTGTTYEYGWLFIIDPDGKYTGVTPSLGFILFADGRTKTMKVASDEGALVISTCGWWFPSGTDPSWFSWN